LEFYLCPQNSPASVLIRKAVGVERGSNEPNKKFVATITRNQLREIAQTKLPDLNANDIEAAMNIVAGTARNMGVKYFRLNLITGRS
jgi:large subunit ribosomal protein L11